MNYEVATSNYTCRMFMLTIDYYYLGSLLKDVYSHQVKGTVVSELKPCCPRREDYKSQGNRCVETAAVAELPLLTAVEREREEEERRKREILVAMIVVIVFTRAAE